VEEVARRAAGGWTFNASGGPDWDTALFTSSVADYFLVDPSTLGGTYDFQLQSIAGIAGEVSIDLYQTNGTQIASFVGVVTTSGQTTAVSGFLHSLGSSPSLRGAAYGRVCRDRRPGRRRLSVQALDRCECWPVVTASAVFPPQGRVEKGCSDRA